MADALRTFLIFLIWVCYVIAEMFNPTFWWIVYRTYLNPKAEFRDGSKPVRVNGKR